MKFNQCSHFEIENGIKVGVKIGYDGIKINASTQWTKKPLLLWYTIDIAESTENQCNIRVSLRSLDTGCKHHITRISPIKSPDDAIRTIRDNINIMSVLSNFITIIHDNVESIKDNISLMLEAHCVSMGNTQNPIRN